MKANTRIFGEIDIAEDKLLSFPEGIVGFPDMKVFALIYDEEKQDSRNIIWLQSLDEPTFAMPICNPLILKPDYNPMIDDEWIRPIGEITEDNLMCFTTMTIPKDITKISINLKAPILINADTRKGRQVIVEDDYEVKFFVYDLLKKKGGK